MAASEHALLSASSAKRWMTCTPSARLEAIFAQGDGSGAAEEGTLAHRIGELKLRKFLGEYTEEEYEEARAGLEVPNDMENYTDSYADFVEERLAFAKAQSNDALLLVEQKLDLTKYVPEGFGTGDAIIVSEEYIEVIDLKYGMGVPVSAIKNPQLRLYGLGAYELLGEIYEPKTIITTIFQPRLDSISSEENEVNSLIAWGEKEVIPKAKKAFKGTGKFVCGEHCQFCKVKKMCRARAEKALTALKYEYKQPPLLTDDDINELLPLLDDVLDWAKAIKEYAYDRALEGTEWRGFKLVEGKSKGTFQDEDAVAEILRAEGLTEEEIYRPTIKFITLTDAKKAITTKRFNEVLGDLVVKVPGKPTLVPDTDKRPAIKMSAEDDFRNLE